jgi:hypothetical protein
VWKEVILELKEVLRESAIQRQIRVESEYQRLEQGSMGYYQFYVEWKKKLLDLEEAGCEMPGPKTLYIQYMQKLFGSENSHPVKRACLRVRKYPEKAEDVARAPSDCQDRASESS